MKMKVIHMTSVTLVFEIIVMFIQFFFRKKWMSPSNNAKSCC